MVTSVMQSYSAMDATYSTVSACAEVLASTLTAYAVSQEPFNYVRRLKQICGSNNAVRTGSNPWQRICFCTAVFQRSRKTMLTGSFSDLLRRGRRCDGVCGETMMISAPFFSEARYFTVFLPALPFSNISACHVFYL